MREIDGRGLRDVAWAMWVGMLYSEFYAVLMGLLGRSVLCVSVEPRAGERAREDIAERFYKAVIATGSEEAGSRYGRYGEGLEEVTRYIGKARESGNYNYMIEASRKADEILGGTSDSWVTIHSSLKRGLSPQSRGQGALDIKEGGPRE